jgi:rhomboid protease GlpG
MRHIGDLPDEALARRLGDYLLAGGVKTAVEPEDGRWAVWVVDEDNVEQAREEFARFQDDPDDARYAAAKQAAADRRRDEQRQVKQYRRNAVDVRRQWARPLLARAPVTAALIAGCIALAAMTTSFRALPSLCDRIEPLLTKFFIVPMQGVPGETGKVQYLTREGLKAVRDGEVHRLVTPIFIHMDVLHLLFNMLWLQLLGGAIELRRGSWRLLGMVLAIAVSSNLAQYWWNGPAFGGMSGVDFGLFAYVWMKSRYEPDSGFFMPPQTVFLMIAWMLICYVGPMHIANAAHTVGLAAGMLFGLWGTFLRKRG